VHTVPYAKFVRLQLLLGESFADISEVSRAAGVPALPLGQLGAIKSELIDSLPAALQKRVLADGLSAKLATEHYEALHKVEWPELSTLGMFMAHQDDFQIALDYFASPELRVRADALVLSGCCPPEVIADALRGWSKYRFTTMAAKLFSFYFCNLEVMVNFANWRQYIDAFKDPDQKWFLGRSYDVQTKGDLVVLMDDLSVRAAISVPSEDTVKDLMMTAFVQMKKEERKVSDGVPAKSTAIFEWASVYCSMFDRVQKVLDTVDKEGALDSIKTRLVSVKSNSNMRRLSDYPLAAAGE